MTDERWEQFIETVQSQFQDVAIRTEQWESESQDQPRQSATVNIVEFYSPQLRARFRVVRQNRPLVLEKKMHYSHRQGDTARTEYITSDTEQSHKIIVYREVDADYDEWEEIKPEALGL